MLKKLYLLLVLLPVFAGAQTKIKLVQYTTSSFSNPVDITHAGDQRLFVVEQNGKIKVVDSLDNQLPTPFLDIEDRVKFSGEQGLLGLAFAPDYAQSGFFYVSYTFEPNGDSRVSRFSVMPGNPNQADPNSEEILLEIDQPYANHNGGSAKFGPDGYLYLGFGDGGSGGDPQNNGQKKTTLLGKILRIDVSDPDTTYTIPPDNPFVGNTAYRPEIWSLGWRNPWRFSFDRLTGDLWIADVGQNNLEEINFEAPGDGGRNYGWRCYEANAAYNTSGCLPASNFTLPVFQFSHSLGCSVTGGFVYRGALYPGLYGLYLFPDYCSGRWWTVKHNADGSFTGTQIIDLADFQYTSMGEDLDGELYVAGYNANKIYRITELCGTFQLAGEATQPTCDSPNGGAIDLTVSGGTLPYNFTWSNGATTEDLGALGGGTFTVVVKDMNNCERRDTFLLNNPMPAAPAVAIVSGDSILCNGDTIMLQAPTAPFGYTLQWYNSGEELAGETGQQLVVTSAGSYSARYVGPCPSAASNTINVDQEFSILYDIIQNGDTLSTYFDADNQYQWLLNDQPVAGADQYFFIPTVTGTYRVQVTSVNGCEYLSASAFIQISSTTTPASVAEFSLAPNPASDKMELRLRLFRSEHIRLTLTDSAQRQIFDQTHQVQELAKTIELQNLPAGTYYLTVKTEGGSFVRQVVKK